MLELKEGEIKAKAIPVNMKKGLTTTKEQDDKYEKTIVMVHAGHLNENTNYVLPQRDSVDIPFQSITHLVTYRANIFNP